MAKTRKSLTENAATSAAASTFVTPSGENIIDGVLSGQAWAGNRLYYAFPDRSSDYGYSGEKNNAFHPVENNIRSAARYILDQAFGGKGNDGFSVEGFTKLHIAEGGDATSEIRYANSTRANPTAYAYYPSNEQRGGDVWFGDIYAYDLARPGNYAFATVIHETGHALGLKHPHEFGGGLETLSRRYDSLEYSVMSYRSHAGASTTSGYINEVWGYPQSFMMADIAALQHMYGADFSANSGDTIYKWRPDSGATWVNGGIAIQPGANRIFATIWDGGGADTYDLRAYNSNLSIDLRPGEESRFNNGQRAQLDFSDPGKRAAGNIYNALLYGGDERSLIENAMGGSGNDRLQGNLGENRLWGNKGGDRLAGGRGDDQLIGGGGADVFVFESGGGRDRIEDFGSADRIDLSAFDFRSFAAVRSHFTQAKYGVVIDFGHDDALVVADGKISELDRDVFML